MHVEVVKYKLAKLIEDHGFEEEMELERVNDIFIIEMEDGTRARVKLELEGEVQ